MLCLQTSLCDESLACAPPWAFSFPSQSDRELACLQVGVPGWLEAFAGHPRIGDVEGLREKFGASAE